MSDIISDPRQIDLEQAIAASIKTITRAQAKSLDHKRYFTGKACKHGHVAERRVCDDKCTTCCQVSDAARKPYQLDYRRSHLSTYANYTAAYRKRNPGLDAAYMVAKRATDREEMLAAERGRYAKSPEKFLAKGKLYRNAKPEVFNSRKK
jgi:hypothetical protein